MKKIIWICAALVVAAAMETTAYAYQIGDRSTEVNSMTEAVIPESATAIDVINMYTHGAIDRDTYNSWTVSHADTAFKLVPMSDIIDFEESIKETEDYIIKFAEGSLPEAVTAEILIYDLVSGDYFISEHTLRDLAVETGAELTVTDWQGIDIVADANGSIMIRSEMMDTEVTGIAEEIETEEVETETEISIPEFASYFDALNAFSHGIIDEITFGAWTEANETLAHAYISVEELAKESGTEVSLVEVAINALGENENIADLIYDAVNGKYYMNRNKLNRDIEKKGAVDNSSTSVKEGSVVEIALELTEPETIPAQENETQPAQNNSSDNSGSQASTQRPTETAAQTQAPTQPVTQPQTQAPTQPATEPATQPPHTHSYQAASSIPASCGLAGSTTYKCSCGDSYTESTPALAHNWEEVVHGFVNHYLPTQFVCNVCGYMTTSESEIGSHVNSGCLSGYYPDDYVIDWVEDIGEVGWDWTGSVSPVGYRCTICGAWQ